VGKPKTGAGGKTLGVGCFGGVGRYALPQRNYPFFFLLGSVGGVSSRKMCWCVPASKTMVLLVSFHENK